MNGTEALALLAQVVMLLDQVTPETLAWPDMVPGRLKAARDVVAAVYRENAR